MGTSYYWREECREVCNKCGHEKEAGFAERHIGKSSGGWTFALHVYPDEGINTLEDWIRIWYIKKGHIRDNYGDTISRICMLQNIMGRGYESHNRSTSEWYIQNQARRGPKGLSQRVGIWVVGYGENEGTWDYCVGDFS